MMTKDVERVLRDTPSLTEGRAIVLTSRKWHPGIIAILAMRLSKHFNRPCVMIASDGQIGKGSVRSIPEFPVLPALKELSNLLLNFGGHDAAAGLTIREQHIEEFTTRFIHIANEKLQETHITPKLYLDAEVPFDQLTFDLMDSLKLLEPYGQGNYPPVFFTEVTQVHDPKIIGRQHLKLFLEHNDRMLEGIASGQSYKLPSLRGWKEPLRLAYTPQVSGASIHLIIRDFQKIDEKEHPTKTSS
jgi:single-stranded-DNA-specific exonuclease